MPRSLRVVRMGGGRVTSFGGELYRWSYAIIDEVTGEDARGVQVSRMRIEPLMVVYETGLGTWPT